jgi:hypothetical protein
MCELKQKEAGLMAVLTLQALPTISHKVGHFEPPPFIHWYTHNGVIL